MIRQSFKGKIRTLKTLKALSMKAGSPRDREIGPEVFQPGDEGAGADAQPHAPPGITMVTFMSRP